MAEATIYIGPWIDWSKGHIFGATLTTTTTQRGLLVAFVAIFVRTAGGSLWQILNFIIHRTRLKDRAQDGLFHQQQIVLRNTSSPAAAAWRQLELSWFWRKRARRGSIRPLPYVILASTYLATLGIASVFSSQVSRSTSTVLVRSPRCGYLNKTAISDDTIVLNEFLPYITYLNTEALNYIQACNESSSKLPSLGNCGIYGNDPLGKLSVSDEPCPFAEGTCLDSEHGVIGVDTGLLDTNLDLGINLPDRFFIRKTTVCAPVQTRDYVTVLLNSNTVTNGSAVYRYGPIYDDIIAYFTNDNTTMDYTYALFPSQQNSDNRLLGILPPYQLDVLTSYAGDSLPYSSDFAPIDNFSRTDADVNLLFLINNNIYDSPVHDLWFESLQSSDDSASAVYVRKSPQVSVLGCIEQYQFCASAEKPSSCTAKQGLLQLQNMEASQYPIFSAPQLALTSHMNQELNLTTINFLVSDLGATSLAAREYSGPNEYLATPVPDDQWKSEVIRFSNVGQIVLRQALIDFAAGPPSRKWESLVQPPDPGSITQSFCSAQKIHTTDYTSFSLLGLSIIFVVGGFLIILNLILPRLTNLIARHRDRRHAHDPWLQDDPLHLQQRAFEQSGLGTWEGQDTNIPVTAMGERMRPSWYQSPQPPPYKANRVKATAHFRAEADLEETDESVLLRPIASSAKSFDGDMERPATQDTLDSYDVGEVMEFHQSC